MIYIKFQFKEKAMISSMTGYCSSTEETKYGSIVVEIKTLNSRYFELQLKLIDDLRVFEPKLREKIIKIIHRGKAECRISIKNNEQKIDLNNINLQHVKKIIATVEKVSSLMKVSQPINALEIAHLASINDNKLNTGQLRKPLMILIDRALNQLLKDRQREGKKIKKIILDKLISIENETKKIKKIFPKVVKVHKDKILKKFKVALINIEQERLKQEVLLFIQKGDITEEIDRLDSHIHELRRLLNLSEPVGKKIDFLMQEFNREANTLGSKSISVEISQASVELKVLIEQIREQIQNIE
jgi:uncharacterized protein (TIGR00255 family)|tara:strand:+ start:5626 stop:6525 length:900 start_codon:yes stop_codon:yes gene_type:complete